ncbi:MAG: leucyl aminopeptidase family protein, partial [Gammaproteobacteria bacterium]
MIGVLPHQVKAKSMRIPLESLENVEIFQHLRGEFPRAATAAPAWLVLLPPRKARVDWTGHPQAEPLRRALRGRREDRVRTVLEGPARPDVLLARLDARRTTPFDRLTQLRDHLGALLEKRHTRLLVDASRLQGELAREAARATLLAVLARIAPLPKFTKEAPDPGWKLTAIHLVGLPERLDVERLRREAIGNHLARWLTTLPANRLTPDQYRRLVARLAAREGWEYRFLGTRQLRRLGAGAFLAVCQASQHPGNGIVHLRYRPRRKRGLKHLALVGKGICFDTGGVNLKTARYMHGMHEDMEGSAVALGAFLALTRMQPPFAIDAWLAVAENLVGPDAYRPNEVVRACNGTHIEVVHTDAEGRMVLADTLALASRERPDLLIDFATLTGACVYALSTRMSGVFTPDETLQQEAVAAGRESGERVWPFPMEADFDEALESAVADIKQCLLEGEADHILAARFLQRFVEEGVPWVHVDLAAGNHKGGLAHVPTDVTGFGVHFTMKLLEKRG